MRVSLKVSGAIVNGLEHGPGVIACTCQSCDSSDFEIKDTTISCSKCGSELLYEYNPSYDESYPLKLNEKVDEILIHLKGD